MQLFVSTQEYEKINKLKKCRETQFIARGGGGLAYPAAVIQTAIFDLTKGRSEELLDEPSELDELDASLLCVLNHL